MPTIQDAKVDLIEKQGELIDALDRQLAVRAEQVAGLERVSETQNKLIANLESQILILKAENNALLAFGRVQ